jgi:hypothetical protein
LEQKSLLRTTASQYRQLLSSAGWLRYEEEVETQAQIAAESLIFAQRQPTQSAEDFALQVATKQAFVLACLNVKSIPRSLIEDVENMEADTT